MPIYEYICNTCHYEFEKIRSFSDSSTPDCPSCENDDVQRKLGVPAIHFKGSGWYINDSKSSDKNKSSKSDTTNSESGSDASSNSDSGNGEGTSNKGDSGSENTSSKSTDSPSTDKPKDAPKAQKKSESSDKKST